MMKRNLWIGVVLCLVTFNLKAQTKENINIEKLIVGHWVFVKTLDANNNEVQYVSKPYKLPDGKEIKIVAKGPEITVYADHTYLKKFTYVNSDTGNWKAKADDKVQYEMVIPKDSRQGDLIRKTQELTGKKWRTDSAGNYLDASVDKILLLTETEMRIQYETNYVLVYKRQ